VRKTPPLNRDWGSHRPMTASCQHTSRRKQRRPTRLKVTFRQINKGEIFPLPDLRTLKFNHKLVKRWACIIENFRGVKSSRTLLRQSSGSMGGFRAPRKAHGQPGKKRDLHESHQRYGAARLAPNGPMGDLDCGDARRMWEVVRAGS